MSKTPGIVEQMPYLHNFSPTQLIAYLCDWSKTHPDCVFETTEIYLISRMLSEHIYRNITKNANKSGVLVIH